MKFDPHTKEYLKNHLQHVRSYVERIERKIEDDILGDNEIMGLCEIANEFNWLFPNAAMELNNALRECGRIL